MMIKNKKTDFINKKFNKLSIYKELSKLDSKKPRWIMMLLFYTILLCRMKIQCILKNEVDLLLNHI